MKKIILILFLGLGIFNLVNGQMMNNFYPSNQAQKVSWEEIVKHTKEEEKEGEILWYKLKNKEIQCRDLNDKDFASLGEYFMGQMTGESHPGMNLMMMRMHGRDGEEAMHILMGKNFSGCETSVLPPSFYNFMPMMNMPMMNMMVSWQNQGFRGNGINYGMWPMMTGYPYFSWLSWIFMILWWLVIILALVVLVRWLIDKLSNKK